jgi:hypothetical protein
MDKTLQTIVGATDTIFFAAATAVSVFMKMVSSTQKMLSIPETIVFSNKKIFLSMESIFLLNQKMVQALEP